MTKYKFIIPKSIILILILSILLNIFRILFFGKLSFIYIFWNIFLALIPFFISYFLLNLSNKNKLTNIILIIGGIFWLFFIPNAPYLVTDLIHIGEIRTVPILYDTILLFSTAVLGLILGLYSIYHIEQILKKKYSFKIATKIIYVLIFLISFGIYLGRFLRFNSWDIIINPIVFINTLGKIFTNKNNCIEAIFYTFLFLFFIIIFYKSWKSTQNNDISK